MINAAKELYEPLEIVSRIPPEEFEERYAMPEVPVVMRDMALDWPASKSWSLQSFCDRMGTMKIEVAHSFDSTKRSMTLRDYIAYMQTTCDEHAYYFKNWAFEKQFPLMRDDYAILPHFQSWLDTLPPSMQPGFRWIFMGPNKSYSKLHIDIFKTNAWNILFEGTKLWLFFPPDQEEKLSVNSFHPDFNGYKFPNAKGLKGYYAVQHPGEIIFTPGNWFHQVYNLGNTLALTENYINHTNYKVVERHLDKIGNTGMLSALRALKSNFCH